MRGLWGAGALLSLVALVACDAPTAGGGRSRTSSKDLTGGTKTPADTATPQGTGVGCPTGLATPAQLATETDAHDIRVNGDNVFYRGGPKVFRVTKAGGAPTTVYTSTNLAHMFTDGSTLIVLEPTADDNGNDATLRIGTVGSDLKTAGKAIATNNATKVYASDTTNFYATGSNDGGDVLFKITRADPTALDTLAQTDGTVADAQLSGGVIWYVKDSTEVDKLLIGGDPAPEPTKVFSVTTGCDLAVGASLVYCTAEGTLESRDLAGTNEKKVFDSTSSKVPVAFGPGIVSGTNVVLTSMGDGPLKNVIRTVAADGTEKVIACGREPVTSVAADATTVVWTEQGKGVFSAPL